MNKTSAIAVAMIGGLYTGHMQADVYRCVADGRTTYTDVPCSKTATPAKLPEIDTVPATPKSDLARQYDADSAREAKANLRARAAVDDDYAVRKNAADAVRKGVIEDRVVAGMTPAQVEQVLNEPTRIEGKDGSSERWFYRDGTHRRTIVFKNGVVVSDATRRPGTRD